MKPRSRTRAGARRVFLAAVAAALLVAGIGAAPASAHNDSCLVAVHFGGIQVHPFCG